MFQKRVAIPFVLTAAALAACSSAGAGENGSDRAAPPGSPVDSTGPGAGSRASAAPAEGGEAATYSVVDLGTLSGASEAHAVNAHGLIAGESIPPFDVDHAVRWADGQMTDLGTLGGTISVGYGINERGVVVGYATLPDKAYRAFLGDGQNALVNLGDLGGDYSAARAINGSGDVVGEAARTDQSIHAFLYREGSMTDLGTLGGEYSSAYGVNDAGQIAGYAYRADGRFHAFLVDQGTMVDLGTLGGSYSRAYAVNTSGDVAGQAYLPGDARAHAFLYEGGVMRDMDTRDNAYSEALALNGAGVVVGDFEDPSGTQHAFISDGSTMTPLDDLLPSATGWSLEAASGISESGQIVGRGTHDGVPRAFRLDPQPPSGAR